MRPKQPSSTPRNHHEDRSKNSKSRVKQVQFTEDHPPPSKISRNYSGSSAYYTPPELVQCLLRGINSLLKAHWGNITHLLAKEINFLDPAAGMAIFPLELLKYAHTQLTSAKFQQWVTTTFVNSMFTFEIDPRICVQAGELLTQTLQQYSRQGPCFPQDHGMCLDPLQSPTSLRS